MSKLRQQFQNIRNSTPKSVQWLLLGATFVVVLILLTLLMTDGKDKIKPKAHDEVPVKITLSADTVDWANITVGTKKTETISVRATAPAKVSMGQNKNVAGFSAKTTCTDAAVIGEKISCNVYLEYKPTVAAKPETLTLSIYYRGEHEPEEMKSAEKIMVILGADSPQPVVKPAPAPKPVVLPETDIDDEDEFDIEPTYVAPKPAAKVDQSVKSIAPSDPFADEIKISTKKPVVDTPMAPAIQPSESCSDFAFPGYDMYGAQSGWIKPESGGYYFYPFSDRNCKNATGIYNPGTGLIVDIKDNGKKIGTDAEHVNSVLATGIVPTLSSSPRTGRVASRQTNMLSEPVGQMGKIELTPAPVSDVEFDTTDQYAVVSTQPYDRTFILRQYKPIPATIVSDVRADTALDAENLHFPVRATVDRNVYSDNGRTIIIPTGTLLLGYVTGKVPGPYKAIGRMNIKWYQFVLPNGVEFNFDSDEPVSADAQGRIGVPGRGSTDYLEQFVMPMLTSIVPAAVNMIAPVADKFVNQIDLDNNTVVQSGTLRSSELAKNEIITAWNQVAQKLLVDMMDNTVPPFTIPAGTRITVYSPNDLMVACTTNEKCLVKNHRPNTTRPTPRWGATADPNDGSWVGQARSFNMERYCARDSNGIWGIDKSQSAADITMNSGYSYSTVLGYCQSLNYQAINNAKQEALYQNQQDPYNSNSVASTGGKGTQAYNEKVLGLKYNENGAIENPFQKSDTSKAESEPVIKCIDGSNPDSYGCCPGEIYTDMGDQGFNCCPDTGGDCFPPIL
ncbi:MAG: TrbI/VirB10 family protein [Alphaproteobacteria bacterium]|nr:TrbI/VirB10 family protein [Alphaproteobacteria bacterium]